MTSFSDPDLPLVCCCRSSRDPRSCTQKGFLKQRQSTYLHPTGITTGHVFSNQLVEDGIWVIIVLFSMTKKVSFIIFVNWVQVHWEKFINTYLNKCGEIKLCLWALLSIWLCACLLSYFLLLFPRNQDFPMTSSSKVAEQQIGIIIKRLIEIEVFRT